MAYRAVRVVELARDLLGVNICRTLRASILNMNFSRAPCEEYEMLTAVDLDALLGGQPSPG
jgi:hypothetical protein